MSEIKRILDQMDRAFSGDAWHGPSLMSVLEGISAEQASKHPIRGAHSIWELVHHIEAWNVWEVSDAAWKRALQNLVEGRGRLRDSVKDFSNELLEGKASGPDYSRYVVLHGVVQHDLYHAGQIVMLKKALAS
jgi:uncharacterized damage-inducible protein DinB